MRVIAAVLLLVAGCAPTRVELPAHLDTATLTDSQRDDVLAAADQWSIATGIDLTSGDGAAIPVRDRILPDASGLTEFSDSGATITINWAQSAGFARRVAVEVIMHELGHLLGLPDGSGLMRSSGLNGACVDAASLEQVCAWYQCSPDAHATCS